MTDLTVLIDGHSMMYRAFYAVDLMSNDRGEYTNAVHVFLMMLFGVFESERPGRCAVAFDTHAPTFRHKEYGEYKAGRAPMPPELIPQIGLIKDILKAMGVPVLELEGYEADDILGTAAERLSVRGMDALVVTGDRDAFQLAGERVSILYTRRGIRDVERVTPEYIKDRYGVAPAQLVDVKGLMGDASDNIPGIPGVGEKTALKLVAEWGSLEAALDSAGSQKGALRERLLKYGDQARLSKRLAAIDRSAPLDLDFGLCEIADISGAAPLLKQLQLKQAEARLNKVNEIYNPERYAPPANERAVERVSGVEILRARAAESKPDWVAAHVSASASVLTSGGLCVSAALGGDLIEPGMSEGEALDAIAPLFAAAKTVIVHDLKRLLRLGAKIGGGAFDVMLAAYVLNPQRKSFSLEALAADEGLKWREGAPAETLYELYLLQREALEAQGMAALFYDVEMPLARVLYNIEQCGFLTDAAALMDLGRVYGQEIETLTAAIRQWAGDDININSPKQLNELLFERLGLAGGKKTKTGYSTNADALEQLQDEHPVIPLILQYRKYFKLKSTYIDALLRLRGADGRIHTSFDQVATATGRISSQEPNLQNIPVRTELGRDIRKAFVARPGWVLVDADYSQIELRVLAHMSGDAVMREAFMLDQDIHTRTAAEIEGVPIDQVTPEMRSAAKAVNFGIVYGISDFGLARSTGVSRKRAADFIQTYFDRYPAVKAYMDSCVETGKALGYVTTIMGRRRYLPEMAGGNQYATRKFGERAAMNSPIQGSAADIIKLAMVRADSELSAGGLAARLILQVHDELIVEAPPEEVDAVSAILKRVMENVAALSVPLRADVSVGASWFDCK